MNNMRQHQVANVTQLQQVGLEGGSVQVARPELTRSTEEDMNLTTDDLMGAIHGVFLAPDRMVEEMEEQDDPVRLVELENVSEGFLQIVQNEFPGLIPTNEKKVSAPRKKKAKKGQAVEVPPPVVVEPMRTLDIMLRTDMTEDGHGTENRSVQVLRVVFRHPEGVGANGKATKRIVTVYDGEVVDSWLQRETDSTNPTPERIRFLLQPENIYTFEDELREVFMAEHETWRDGETTSEDEVEYDKLNITNAAAKVREMQSGMEIIGTQRENVLKAAEAADLLLEVTAYTTAFADLKEAEEVHSQAVQGVEDEDNDFTQATLEDAENNLVVAQGLVTVARDAMSKAVGEKYTDCSGLVECLEEFEVLKGHKDDMPKDALF
jgi:hypothetical protein